MRTLVRRFWRRPQVTHLFEVGWVRVMILWRSETNHYTHQSKFDASPLSSLCPSLFLSSSEISKFTILHLDLWPISDQSLVGYVDGCLTSVGCLLLVAATFVLVDCCFMVGCVMLALEFSCSLYLIMLVSAAFLLATCYCGLMYIRWVLFLFLPLGSPVLFV